MPTKCQMISSWLVNNNWNKLLKKKMWDSKIKTTTHCYIDNKWSEIFIHSLRKNIKHTKVILFFLLKFAKLNQCQFINFYKKLQSLKVDYSRFRLLYSPWGHGMLFFLQYTKYCLFCRELFWVFSSDSCIAYIIQIRKT